MGREIQYDIRSPRPFTAAEMKAAEMVVLAANHLFHSYAGTDFVNLTCVDGLKDGAQFFTHGTGSGSTKPRGDETALFLFACLVALSAALPSASIHVQDEGNPDSPVPTIKPRTVLQAGWVKFLKADGTLSDRLHASFAINAGHRIDDINARLPRGVKKFAASPVRVLLRQVDVRLLIPNVGSAIKRIVADMTAASTPAPAAPTSIEGSLTLH